MDFLSIMRLFSSGGSVWSKMSALLYIASGIGAAFDSNKTGADDMISGIAANAAAGLDAYDRKDYNRAGNIIDALVAGLLGLKQTWIDSGFIKPRTGSAADGVVLSDRKPFAASDYSNADQPKTNQPPTSWARRSTDFPPNE